MSDHNRDLCRLLDALIPGDRRWPSASAAGVTGAAIEAESDAGTVDWALALGATAPELAETERREPARFRRLLAAVYRAYYTTPAVQAVVTALANAGPREPSAHFDDSLVARVIATQAGKRRATMPADIVLSSPANVAPATTYEHVARAVDFAFVAGQIAKDERGNWVGLGDAGAQARQVYVNIGRILDSIGARPADVVKINTILVDRADRDAVTAERLKFFGSHRPPHTGIIIAGLGSPEVRVEVEVVVYLPPGRGR